MEDVPLGARMSFSLGLGLILGYLVLVNWSPYQDYAVLVAPTMTEYAFGALTGFAIAWCSAAEKSWLGLEVLALVTGLVVPVVANASTALLIGNEALLDVIVYSALRRALAHGVALAVFFAMGGGLGVIVRAWRS